MRKIFNVALVIPVVLRAVGGKQRRGRRRRSGVDAGGGGGHRRVTRHGRRRDAPHAPHGTIATYLDRHHLLAFFHFHFAPNNRDSLTARTP